ncbi:MAG: tRNA (N(6)-L-threonylcarbamoyladenosine(37)-C(2))-methylthiotransferase MtaB [Clostridia bacterium]|nr:tRNA (N(6)-L-threonylcarbamoyladenosine(37)-C(2))-methylthiotransferase MtaB [Clostridia bacterium]
MKVAFYTLGCKVNQYDTQAMAEIMQAAGHDVVEFDECADIYVINTCTVTQVADRKSRQIISRAREKAPHAGIIVTGCYSQRAPGEVLAIEGVSLVCGTADRGRIAMLAEDIHKNGNVKQNAVIDNKNLEFEDISAIKEGRTRAYLKIQDGCDRYCTYCAIPYVRGNIRSRSLESIRKELIKLEREGFREIVFTGIHLMSYGRDKNDGTSLVDAIRMADGLLGIRRIRLGSLEPKLLTDELLLELSQNKRICRQFHLSLQSGSKSVLRRMGRRYTPEEYLLGVERLRAALPGSAITTDIIVGFPGETDEEFNETLEFVKKVGFAKVHAFPYSRRSGTAADRFKDQIPNEIKSKRNARLIEVASGIRLELLKKTIGSTREILIEQHENGIIMGHTDDYLYVRAMCDDKENRSNTFADIKVTHVEGDGLFGVIV